MLPDSSSGASQHTLELIDEVGRIINECSAEAELGEHALDRLAQALLERETLDEADAYAAAGIPQPTAGAQLVHEYMTRQRARASSPSSRARPTASVRSWAWSLA